MRIVLLCLCLFDFLVCLSASFVYLFVFLVLCTTARTYVRRNVLILRWIYQIRVDISDYGRSKRKKILFIRFSHFPVRIWTFFGVVLPLGTSMRFGLPLLRKAGNVRGLDLLSINQTNIKGIILKVFNNAQSVHPML